MAVKSGCRLGKQGVVVGEVANCDVAPGKVLVAGLGSACRLRANRDKGSFPFACKTGWPSICQGMHPLLRPGVWPADLDFP